MLIGLDLDNTIVCYDSVFAEMARARGVPAPVIESGKTGIRDYFRKLGQEDIWTEMQGKAYGPNMQNASEFAGLAEFLTGLSQAGHRAVIISHRSKKPYRGTAFDLHGAAMSWWNTRNYCNLVTNLFLELTAESKASRIRSEGCEVFVDDLVEFLGRADLPPELRKIWLDHAGHASPRPGLAVAHGWRDVSRLVAA